MQCTVSARRMCSKLNARVKAPKNRDAGMHRQEGRGGGEQSIAFRGGKAIVRWLYNDCACVYRTHSIKSPLKPRIISSAFDTPPSRLLLPLLLLLYLFAAISSDV